MNQNSAGSSTLNSSGLNLRVGINHRIFVVILLFAVVCSALASLQLFTVNRASALDMEDAGQLAISFTERVAQLNVSAGLNLSQRIAASRLPSSKHLMTDVETVTIATR